MMTKFKKLIASLLTFVMLFSNIPISAGADPVVFDMTDKIQVSFSVKEGETPLSSVSWDGRYYLYGLAKGTFIKEDGNPEASDQYGKFLVPYSGTPSMIKSINYNGQEYYLGAETGKKFTAISDVKDLVLVRIKDSHTGEVGNNLDQNNYEPIPIGKKFNGGLFTVDNITCNPIGNVEAGHGYAVNVSIAKLPQNTYSGTDYDYDKILGKAIEFGIVADTYDQTGSHTETNFAVNYYKAGEHVVEVDLSNAADIPFAIGHISSGDLRFGAQTDSNNIDVYRVENDRGSILQDNINLHIREIELTQEQFTSKMNELWLTPQSKSSARRAN